MDEAGGCCGLLVLLVVIVLAIVVWRGMRQEAGPAPPPPAPVAESGEAGQAGPRAGDQAPPPEEARQLAPVGRVPIGARAALLVVGLLYCVGLLLIRPAARRAKRNGASNQQAALTALTLFAMSPVVVPVKGIWYGLGAVGEALTRNPEDRAKPSKPRGLDDLD
ncbi:hypothetical protein AB1L88_21720 [Tautonia sp. JC769]|uniref:hypothetical protein n=1 Tax=Tautonia sp. JC769 TaxID=3232135 RepID=UPI003458F346